MYSTTKLCYIYCSRKTFCVKIKEVHDAVLERNAYSRRLCENLRLKTKNTLNDFIKNLTNGSTDVHITVVLQRRPIFWRSRTESLSLLFATQLKSWLTITINTRKLSLIEDRGHTDRAFWGVYIGGE